MAARVPPGALSPSLPLPPASPPAPGGGQGLPALGQDSPWHNHKHARTGAARLQATPLPAGPPWPPRHNRCPAHSVSPARHPGQAVTPRHLTAQPTEDRDLQQAPVHTSRHLPAPSPTPPSPYPQMASSLPSLGLQPRHNSAHSHPTLSFLQTHVRPHLWGKKSTQVAWT